MADFEITNPQKMPFEKVLFETMRHHPEQFHLAPEDGDYDEFDTLFKRRNTKGRRAIFGIIGHGNSRRNKFRIVRAMLKQAPGIFRTKYRLVKDITPVLEDIQEGNYTRPGDDLVSTDYPNQELWNEITSYALRRHGITSIGFTKVPNEFIFKDRGILYRHAIVLCQEQKKEEIDKAPDIAAGAEVQRIYNTLGRASLDVSRWLRKKGFVLQGDHPSGGLVNFVPLAAKAGLGSIGHNGLLITPEYGQRVRITAIYTAEKIFEYTDHTDHNWIHKYCDLCTRCINKCPTDAIYRERQPLRDGVEGFGEMKVCIDNEKCFPYFAKTLGCNICVKVCPFSKSNEMYDRLHKVWIKRKERLESGEMIILD